MKTKLLIKLRNRGRTMIDITSITKTNGTVTGMRYGYGDKVYRGLFNYGDTEFDVTEKAARIYIQHNITDIRDRYYKYSRRNPKTGFLKTLWLCKIFKIHKWTCAAEQGIDPTSEQLSNDIAGFWDYAKMYCKRCGCISELAKKKLCNSKN